MQLGLLNGFIGALAGSLVVRLVKWLFEVGFGREALGLGDADLLMMAGAFLGWQIAVLSFFIGAMAALVLKIVELVLSEAVTRAGQPGVAVRAGAGAGGGDHVVRVEVARPAGAVRILRWFTLGVSVGLIASGCSPPGCSCGDPRKSRRPRRRSSRDAKRSVTTWPIS